MDGKVWQTSTEAQAGKGPQREREVGEDRGVCVCMCVCVGGINGVVSEGRGGLPNQSESWQFNYKEIKGHSSFN